MNPLCKGREKLKFSKNALNAHELRFTAEMSEILS